MSRGRWKTSSLVKRRMRRIPAQPARSLKRIVSFWWAALVPCQVKPSISMPRPSARKRKSSRAVRPRSVVTSAWDSGCRPPAAISRRALLSAGEPLAGSARASARRAARVPGRRGASSNARATSSRRTRPWESAESAAMTASSSGRARSRSHSVRTAVVTRTPETTATSLSASGIRWTTAPAPRLRPPTDVNSGLHGRISTIPCAAAAALWLATSSGQCSCAARRRSRRPVSRPGSAHAPACSRDQPARRSERAAAPRERPAATAWDVSTTPPCAAASSCRRECSCECGRDCGCECRRGQGPCGRRRAPQDRG